MTMPPQAARDLKTAGVLYLVATLLGLAFNAASPLGVTPIPQGDTAPVAGGTGHSYAVETQSVRILPANPAAVARQPGTGIHGEAIAVTVRGEAVAGSSSPLPSPTNPAEVAPHDPVARHPKKITWPQAKVLLAQGTAVLVDARDENAFRAGHIPGAVSLPGNLLSDRISTFAAEHPPEMTIIVYCASSQCATSHQVGQILMERHGYTDVRDMPGGFAEWRLADSRTGGSP